MNTFHASCLISESVDVSCQIPVSFSIGILWGVCQQYLGELEVTYSGGKGRGHMDCLLGFFRVDQSGRTGVVDPFDGSREQTPSCAVDGVWGDRGWVESFRDDSMLEIVRRNC